MLSRKRGGGREFELKARGWRLVIETFKPGSARVFALNIYRPTKPTPEHEARAQMKEDAGFGKDEII